MRLFELPVLYLVAAEKMAGSCVAIGAPDLPVLGDSMIAYYTVTIGP